MTITWPRYVAGCSVPGILSLCASRTYVAGTLVVFESNGQNRLGGMTGFSPVFWLVRKDLDDGSLSDGAAGGQLTRIAAATDDQLKRRLGLEETAEYSGDPAAILHTARSILEGHGYTVADDPGTGGLITAARALKLSADQADCGKIMGIGYIHDKRTETTVLLTVTAQDSRIRVRMAVDGVQHVKVFGQVDDNMLTCNSRGVLEKSLADEIARAIGR